MMKYLFAILLLAISICLYAQKKVMPTDELTITGLIEKDITLTINEIKKYPQDNLGDIAIKNNEGKIKSTAKNVKGTLLINLLKSVSAPIAKPKDYASLYVVLTASDGYKIVYSWGELFNTETGKHLYILTAKNDQEIEDMPDRILVYSFGDSEGMRHIKSLIKIEIKKAE